MKRAHSVDVLNKTSGLAQPPRAGLSATPTFAQNFQTLLGRRKATEKVNEEELFAASLYDRIKGSYGESLAADFKSAFQLNMADKPRRERIGSAERAANETLAFFANSTKLSPEQIAALRDECFRAAQVDSHAGALWDSRGSAKDKTIAVVPFARAQRLIRERFS
jgi:hypothetical protein